MSLITILNSNSQLGRQELVKIFRFWFEDYVISLYNKFKLERKTDLKKVKSGKKNSKII